MQFMWHHLIAQDASDKKNISGKKTEEFWGSVICTGVRMFFLNGVSQFCAFWYLFNTWNLFFGLQNFRPLGHSLSYLYNYDFES